MSRDASAAFPTCAFSNPFPSLPPFVFSLVRARRDRGDVVVATLVIPAARRPILDFCISLFIYFFRKEGIVCTEKEHSCNFIRPRDRLALF